MFQLSRRLLPLLGAVAALGCSAGGAAHSLIVGNEGAGGATGGTSGGGGVVFSGDSGISSALAAHFESPRGMTVTFVTVSCADKCADVEAVATGGFKPYTFTWDDGATGPDRHVCPTASTSYQLTVKDAGVSSGEFQTAPATVKAALTANVIACPATGGDGGTTVTGPCDSLADGFSATGTNPSAAWSYGYTSSVGSAFTLYPKFIAQDLTATAYSTDGSPSIAQWFDPANGVISGTGAIPDIQFNPLTTTVHPGVGNFSGDSWEVGPGQIVMSSINLGTMSSVARWTAASAGTYFVKAAFASAATPGFTQTSDVHVQHDSTDLSGGAGSITTTTTAFSFNANVDVRAGDTLDFVVAPSTAIAYHMTSVDARVCTVTPKE